MKEKHTKKRVLIALAACISLCVVLVGCRIAIFDSYINEIKGKLTGNSYHCYFYDNSGEKFLTVYGEKIGLIGNVVEDVTIDSTDGSLSRGYSLSSVVTITVDGKQMESCGDTIIFEQEGLTPDKEFALTDIDSSTDGSLGDNTLLANIINKYKNAFGKGTVVVIQSQLGNPICAYSGDDVYWEVCDDLPKTTKLMIDGKALYIHRANFQIIDKELIDENE